MSQQTTNETPVPAGYLKDAKGRLVPEDMVKPIDKLRDVLVQALAKQASDLSAVLASFKRVAFADIETFVETSASQYGVKVRGNKGNLTLYSYDGRYKIVRQVADRIRFDERLQAAKALIDECITEWAQSSRSEIQLLVNDAFRVDKEGEVNASAVLSLRRHDIRDEKWKRAMVAISDSLQVVGSTSYVRVYERVGDSEQYQVIPLDITGV